ncbi:hypothetical protein ACLQ28_34450, partial [Micromonospora sp. DT201]|uniref:hypothetical protein n=1 Tax=Micromonospora sp. DT201 TaxID=3393442 RepID=UPI003CF417EA
GSVVEFGADGVVLRQVLPDGTVFSGFDGSGRPTEGSAADGQDFTLEYPGNGNTITRYADGATAEFNPDGIIIRQVTPDGTVYISFDAENRPDKGYSPDSGAFTVEYPSEGHTVYRYDNGLVVEYGPNSLPIRQVLPDTTTFTSFDEDGRPTQGTAPDGASISITYQDNGGSEITYGSGVLVRYNAQGDPYFMRTADGSVFTEFYENGDPKNGKTAEGVSVGIVYDSDGGSEITYGSGVVVRVNGNGDPVW